MKVNKVIYAGTTLIDLTSDSVTPDSLALGVTAHDASGKVIVGTATILNYEVVSGPIDRDPSKPTYGLT